MKPELQIHLSKNRGVGSNAKLSKEINYFEIQHPLTHMGTFMANAVLPLYSQPFVCCDWLPT